ncbi:unnamed protein product [Ceutorhynchus assimilis]|uniref:COX assembly mitochondrial protein n=1 Tax=Ceutorhynchus assimilis TaxID=467358 RepID=A0A9N9MP20_9CUCU|nr:unnamed protein product [Ceutorhynchus assimilis]
MESSNKASTVAECTKIIEESKICVQQSSPFEKLIRGVCNDLNKEADRCRGLIWRIQQRENYEKSKAMKRKWQEKLQQQSK